MFRLCKPFALGGWHTLISIHYKYYFYIQNLLLHGFNHT